MPSGYSGAQVSAQKTGANLGHRAVFSGLRFRLVSGNVSSVLWISPVGYLYRNFVQDRRNRWPLLS
jgi:hypothetical protein